jgi:uncharacterized protein with HEPN domain
MNLDPGYLEHIYKSANRILKYVQSLTYEMFLLDEKTQDAVVQRIQIIGEATKLLSDEFRAAHPTIEWKKMARMRDVLIHRYNDIRLDVVWETCQTDIPALESYIRPLIESMPDDIAIKDEDT